MKQNNVSVAALVYLNDEVNNFTDYESFTSISLFFKQYYDKGLIDSLHAD